MKEGETNETQRPSIEEFIALLKSVLSGFPDIPEKIDALTEVALTEARRNIFELVASSQMQDTLPLLIEVLNNKNDRDYPEITKGLSSAQKAALGGILSDILKRTSTE